jgi:hypothetical protein
VIIVELPPHLRRFVGDRRSVRLDVDGTPSVASVLDALEAEFPALMGTIRDHGRGPRRAFIRFYAAGEDLSMEPIDAPLPHAVASGDEPLLIVGAIAGG